MKFAYDSFRTTHCGLQYFVINDLVISLSMIALTATSNPWSDNNFERKAVLSNKS